MGEELDAGYIDLSREPLPEAERVTLGTLYGKKPKRGGADDTDAAGDIDSAMEGMSIDREGDEGDEGDEGSLIPAVAAIPLMTSSGSGPIRLFGKSLLICLQLMEIAWKSLE